MPRRWIMAVTAGLAALALACEGGDGIGQPSEPPPSPRPGLPVSMAALGDSVTTGFGSCLSLTTCTRNSWSTGDGLRVDSHYRRLRDMHPAIRDKARNHAAGGARVAALTGQATAAVKSPVEYVTVLIGANDVCRRRVEEMTPVRTFRAEVDQALGVLRAADPRPRVLVASVPDLYRLWEIGHTNERAVRAWSRGICPALLANATSTAEADVARRSAVRERIDAYNAQLAAACRRYGSRCRYDGGAVHRVRFTLDLVNPLDYFHPNVAGQNKLADVTWAASGFAGRAD